MGISYIIDFCLAEYKAVKEQRAFQTYITDCLQMMTESNAKFAGGKYMTGRFKQIMGWEKAVSIEPEKTGAEIIDDVKGRITSLFGGGSDGEQ